MKLFTQRLVLRNFVESDIEHYVRMTSLPVYQCFYPEDQCSAEFGQNLVAGFIAEGNHWPRLRYHMAIEHSLLEKWIGVASVRVEKSGVATVGFGIDPEFWGQGIVVEAMTALMEYAVKEHKLTMLYAETLDANEGAKSVLEKMGFVLSQVHPNQFFFRDKSWVGVTYIRKVGTERGQTLRV